MVPKNLDVPSEVVVNAQSALCWKIRHSAPSCLFHLLTAHSNVITANVQIFTHRGSTERLPAAPHLPLRANSIDLMAVVLLVPVVTLKEATSS